MGNALATPRSAALVGIPFALPFVSLNAIAASRLEPFYTAFTAVGLDNVSGFGAGLVIFASVFLLLPLGAFIALRPLLQGRTRGAFGWAIAEIAVAAVLMALFLLVSVGLGEEIYRCEILQIPNCD
jgi:hypothetical protein